MPENRRTIGSNMAELRGGRSQKEVAEALGISVSALSMYETDNRVPRDQIKVKIADYYGVTVQELFF